MKKLNKMIWIYLLIFICLIIANGLKAQTIEGKLIGIDDGDTFTLLDDAHRQYKIRLNGIDCPEKAQDYGKVAKNFTYNFCTGKRVKVQVIGTDKYDRYLGDVTVNGSSLNQALVRNGLAWHYKKYSSDPVLAQLEVNARNEKLNIWSMANAMAPWDWRHRGELQEIGTLSYGNVFICNSSGSKTYHKKMCNGLSRCGKGISQVSESKALSMGKKACGYCY
jgi:endonuclease YncB( thermonuclease family)